MYLYACDKSPDTQSVCGSSPLPVVLVGKNDSQVTRSMTIYSQITCYAMLCSSHARAGNMQMLAVGCSVFVFRGSF